MFIKLWINFKKNNNLTVTVIGYPKPFSLIMKNYKTVFQDLNDRCSFECNHDVHDEEIISINISIESNETTDKDSFICLDIESAIKLTKVLKAEIYEAKKLQEAYNTHNLTKVI